MEPKIEIEHNKPSKTYFPGEQITGTVIIIACGRNETDRTVLTEVKIRLEGRRAAVKRRNKLEEFYFLEKEALLLNTEIVLLADEVLDLPFQFQLPHKLPSSFQVSRGLVEYSLVVKLRRSSEFDLSYKSLFYVNGVLILQPTDNQCIELHQSKSVGFCSCFNFRKAHRFGVTLRLPKDQYLPGEELNYFVKIWNSSERALTDVTISLIRELQLLDSGDFHDAVKEQEIICSILGPQVQPFEKLLWTSHPQQTEENVMNNRSRLAKIIKAPLFIPEDSLPSCDRVVQLKYFVKISLQATGLCSSTLECKSCPILVGTSN